MSQAAPGPIGGPPDEAGGPATTPSDLDDLQQRIRRTREDLGQTVAALSARTQVRARARDRACELADRVRYSAAFTRVLEYDPVGHIRSAHPVDRVRRADVVERIRRADLPSRARNHPLPVILLTAIVTGLATAAVLTRRRRLPAGSRPPRSRPNRLRGRR